VLASEDFARQRNSRLADGFIHVEADCISDGFPVSESQGSPTGAASWHTLEAALTTALTRAQVQGEISDGKDARALARHLLVLLQGIRVLARTSTNSDRLREATTVTLGFLEDQA
jgi:hypothetical protein